MHRFVRERGVFDSRTIYCVLGAISTRINKQYPRQSKNKIARNDCRGRNISSAVPRLPDALIRTSIARRPAPIYLSSRLFLMKLKARVHRAWPVDRSRYTYVSNYQRIIVERGSTRFAPADDNYFCVSHNYCRDGN